MYFGHRSIKEARLEQTLLPGLDCSFSWIAKASPQHWRIQSSLSMHCLPLELFLWAFDDHGYSIPASPLPHSYASLPCLLSHTHFLTMGQIYAGVSP